MSKDKDRFNAFKKDLNLSNEKIAKIIGGASGNAIEAATSERQYPFPNWPKLAVWVWEQYKNDKLK